jgi:multiple sugar transport system substrate-binding protein
LAIAASTEHPDEAWEFLKWWTATSENALLWAQTSNNLPGLLATLDDPYFAEDPYLAPFVETLKIAEIRPPLAGYSPMEVDAVIPNLQLFITGDLTAEEALAAAQEQGDLILEENMSN